METSENRQGGLQHGCRADSRRSSLEFLATKGQRESRSSRPCYSSRAQQQCRDTIRDKGGAGPASLRTKHTYAHSSAHKGVDGGEEDRPAGRESRESERGAYFIISGLYFMRNEINSRRSVTFYPARHTKPRVRRLKKERKELALFHQPSP